MALGRLFHRRLAVPASRPPSRLRTVSSFVRGSTTPPLLEHTFPQFYKDRLLPDFSNATALISTHEPRQPYGGPLRPLTEKPYLSWTFEELDRHVAALARGLVKLGVQKGDRVGVVMGNNSAYATLQWACARIGAISVTTNPAYSMSEMIVAMDLAGVSTLFITPRLRSSDYISLLNKALPTLASTRQGDAISDSALPSLRRIVLLDNVSYNGIDFQEKLDGIPSAVDYREVLVWREDGSANEEMQRVTNSLDKDEVVNLQFTSGTTGAPKAVSLTHHNLLNNGRSIGACMNLTSQDIICNVPPLFHCFGLVLGNLGSWTHGATVVYPAESFDPRATLDTIEKERCTGVHGVPTHFLGMMGEIDKGRKEGKIWDLGSLRTGIAAGSTVPIDLMEQLIGKLNLRDLTNAYGMTETSPVSFQTVPSDPMVKRTETVGRVQPHVIAKVVDPKGNIVDRGVPGELCVSGYLVHKGYWNNPEQSASISKREVDPDGAAEREWIYTGDEAILDEEGYIRIVGRLKDLIIRGGENLFPVQIENVLTAHPQIREAAAVAVPDQKYGEVVGLWIVREPAEESKLGVMSPLDVRNWVKEKMNPQNAPAHVWFFGEEELTKRGYEDLPKTGSGKVQKNILRNWSKELAKDGIGSLQPLLKK
ncbi:acyl-CoA synthetase [Clavulina sp. PMI_390]|nr:acyl-CoA synthetase [Clavulina sp. PMI_390]